MNKIKGWAKAIWDFMDGNKSFLVAIVSTVRLMCPGCYGVSVADSILHAFGWDTVTEAFNPLQAAAGLAVVLAFGHRLLKMYQQHSVGVPVQFLGSEKGVVTAAAVTGEVHAIVAEVKDEAPKVS